MDGYRPEGVSPHKRQACYPNAITTFLPREASPEGSSAGFDVQLSPPSGRPLLGCIGYSPLHDSSHLSIAAKIGKRTDRPGTRWWSLKLAQHCQC